MKNMTLARMAEACGGSYYGRAEDRDREICSVTTDSRKAEPGCLFAAIRGERVDGHDFIASVFEKGALCALVETPPHLSSAAGRADNEKNASHLVGALETPPAEQAGNYIKVESTIRALGALAAYYLEQLAIPVVGVTGSVGKTSTKEMIAAVLSQKYHTLKTTGNFNNELGLPLTIFRLRDEDEIAVLEMGINHFGEMHRLAQIAKPDTCVITNIGQCHLEFLGDRDGVLRAKTEIFDFLRPDGHIILNGDDDKLAAVREVKAAQNAVIRPTFFGMGTENAVYADRIVKKGLDGVECRIHIASGDCFTVRIPIPGVHMVRNALAATAVGLRYGLTTEEIRAGIESLQPVSGRFHIIHTENFTIIDDCYNANPMSMKASLEVLQDGSDEEKPGRRVAILGDMGELGGGEEQMHREVGEFAGRLDIDLCVCVGSLSARIAEGISEVSPEKKALTLPDLPALLAQLPSLVKRGDTILVKASHFMHFETVVAKLEEMDQAEVRT
ncbi:MAG: UDP-N-acetylmuramoyl-tripeptide--D-alanyl-D-alanine ligase [Lachnospiraceae bacterium]|nr:UDP-N-acetylmuramoyl-tripeptide--D-alanyl-D-alanine ligase [Lachnospiraceae bacterium]